jgi:hypothetical protein
MAVMRGSEPNPPAAVNSRLALVGVVLAVLIPPVGVVVSFIARQRARRNAGQGGGLSIVGICCGTVLTVPFLFGIAWLGADALGWLDNVARDRAQPFIAKVQAAGGDKLCDNGDGGHGPDNYQPWYQTYYRISDHPGLTRKLESDAARLGLVLHNDTRLTAELRNAPEPSKPFNPKADYLTGKKRGFRFDVRINRDGAVPLYCGADYGHSEPTGAGNAIVNVHVVQADP